MWIRPRQAAPTNIYEGMVTHNITEPNYTVDEAGFTAAYHPLARARAALMDYNNRPDTPIAVPPPQKMERQWNGDGTYSMIMTVPKSYRSG